MMTAIQQNLMSVEEYLKFEETSELRHEYINGQLFEMPGEKKINNKIAGFLYVYFFTFLTSRGYNVYNQAVKVTIPNEKKFYYPDLLLTAEPESEGNEYVVYHPELIVEVLSKTSRTRDNVDKYLDYIKIPSLKYYLIIDPERIHVTIHSKGDAGEWEAEVYSDKTDIIPLPLLQTELPITTVYPS
jgi:Uma2 family endonuclease